MSRSSTAHAARGGVAAALLALAALVAGCGEDAAPPLQERSASEHDADDVAFATAMVPHHAQALALVDLTLGRDLDPEVAALAEAIREAQVPEIETMSDWLVEWGEPVPATVRDHVNAGHDGHDPGEVMEEMGGMDGSGDPMPGMLTAEELTDLAQASDAAFQDAWLAAMLRHHEGAVEMARTEVEDGRYSPAVDLAEQIIATQSDEIEQIRVLLDS